MSVTEITGVIKDIPVPIDNPPVEFAYQLIVPALAVAPKVAVPESQMESVVVVKVFTNAITAVREVVVHAPIVAST